jgi:hypothetical protein
LGECLKTPPRHAEGNENTDDLSVLGLTPAQSWMCIKVHPGAADNNNRS